MTNDLPDIKDLPGLRDSELGPCSFCGKPNGPVFYRATIEQFMVDQSALQRRAGMELMTGSHVLAAVMSPDEYLARQTSKLSHIVCADCALSTPVLALLEESE